MTDKELEQIYNNAYRAVYWTAMSLLKNEADAEDVVQDTFVAFIESYPDIKDTGKATALLKKIASNKCLDRIKLARTDSVEDEFFDNVEAVPEDFLPDTIIESAEMRKIVMDIINNSLSDDIRRTLILFYFDEMSTKEIAELLGIPQGTVLWRLNFAKKKIKKEVEKYEEDNDTKLFGMVIPFLSKLFTKESEQVVFKPMPASLADLSASVKASGKGADIKASAEAVKKGTDIMKTKILIGSIAAVVAVGATTGIILGVMSRNKEVKSRNTEDAGMSQPETTRIYADYSEWTEPEDTETEPTETSKKITDDSIFLLMDGMTVDECVDNLWKTSNVYVGMSKDEYFENIITPEEDPAIGYDDSFSWNFQPSMSRGVRYIGSVRICSGISCPIVYEGGEFSVVRLQVHYGEDDREFANELVDKLIERYVAEGYTVKDDDSLYNGSRLVHIEGADHLISIADTGSAIVFEIPLVSG